MKFYIKLMVMALIAGTSTALQAKYNREVITLGNLCVTDTGVNPDLYRQMKEGTYVEDPLLKEYLYCVHWKTHIIDKEGNIDKKIYRMALKGFIDDEDIVNEIVEKCSETKGSPEETVYEATKCKYNILIENNAKFVNDPFVLQ